MAKVLVIYSFEGVVKRDMDVCDAYETTNIRILLEHRKLLTVLFNDMVSDNMLIFKAEIISFASMVWLQIIDKGDASDILMLD